MRDAYACAGSGFILPMQLMNLMTDFAAAINADIADSMISMIFFLRIVTTPLVYIVRVEYIENMRDHTKKGRMR